MDNILKFTVDVNTASGEIALGRLGGATTRVGTDAVKAGGMFSASFGSGLVANISHVTQIVTNLSNMIGTATAKVSEFVTASNTQNMALKGLSEVSRAYGQDMQTANKYAQELTNDGLMKLTSASQTLKFLMASKFSISEAMDIAKSMKDIGAFNNTVGSVDQAMVDAAKGFKTGSIELIENIGLTQKLSAVMKDAGVDVSNGIDLTNSAAQRQAVYNMIMAEGNKFQGNAAKLAQDNSGAYAQLGNSIETAKAKVGDILNIGLVPLARITGDLVKSGSALDGVITTVAVGVTVALIPAVIGLTAKTWALVAAQTAATGGLNLVAASVAALTIGGAVYVASLDSSTEAIKKQASEIANLHERIEQLKNALPSMTEDQKRLELERLNYMLELRKSENISVTKQWFAQKEIVEKREKLRSWDLDKEREKFRQLEILRQTNISVMGVYSQKIALLEQSADSKKVTEFSAKSKEDYLNHLLEMKKAGAEFTKTEEEIFNNNFTTVSAYVTKTGKVVEASYRRKSELSDKATETEIKKLKEANSYLWANEEHREKFAEEAWKNQHERNKTRYESQLSENKRNNEELDKLNIDKWNKELNATKEYYETVKFADEKYIDWKKAEIVKELQEKGLTDDQVKAASVVLYADLTEQHKKYIEEKKKLDETFATKMAKGFAESALSGMQSEIDSILNYKRRRTNAEYDLDRKLSESNYKASVKRIDDELKAEKRGSDRYKQLQLERQKLDADYAKSKSELDAQQEADNLSGMERVQAVLKAGMKSGIQATASFVAAKVFEKVWAGQPWFTAIVAAPLLAATTYAAVSAFGGMFEQGGRVPGGVLTGVSHKQGGIWINAEGGEYIMSRKAVAKVGVENLDALNFGHSLPVLRPKLPAYEIGGVVNYGFVPAGGMSDAKMDRMIALLEANNKINYGKDQTVVIYQKDVDPKIVAKKANKGNKDLTVTRRIGGSI